MLTECCKCEMKRPCVTIRIDLDCRTEPAIMTRYCCVRCLSIAQSELRHDMVSNDRAWFEVWDVGVCKIRHLGGKDEKLHRRKKSSHVR